MNSFLSLFISLVILWAVFFVIAKIITTLFPQLLVSETSQIVIKPGYFKWFTTSLNPAFIWVARSNRQLMNAWFSLGVIAGAFGMLSAVGILVANLFLILAQPAAETQLLTPIIPGVNVASSQLPYYFISLLIAGILHEFGHAVAAISEGRTVNGFAVFVMVIYPGALVDLSNDIFQLSPFRQLKIFCAGAWHNIIIAVVAFLLAQSQVSEIVLAPLFTTSPTGVAIASVNSGSILEGLVEPGQLLTRVNQYPITNAEDWWQAFNTMYKEGFKQPGFCTAQWTARPTEPRSLDCCDENYQGGITCWIDADDESHKVCLPASEVVSFRPAFLCESAMPRGCTLFPALMSCLKPQLPSDTKSQMIMAVDREGFNTSLLFLAHPAAIFHSIKVTDMKLRFGFLPTWMAILPIALEQTLSFLCTISAALAILNLAPAYYLDGEHALRAYIQLLFPHWSSVSQEKLAVSIFRAVSALFVVNMVVSIGVMYL